MILFSRMSPIWFNEAVLDKIYGEYFSYAAPIANMGNLRERERERACTAKFCFGAARSGCG